MRLSGRTLDRLTATITGDGSAFPYRTGPQIVSFFNGIGVTDSYEGFGSRNPHTRAILDKINGSPSMQDAVLAAFNMWGEPGLDCEAEATEFNKLLARDGFRLAKMNSEGWMESGRFVEGPATFHVVPIRGGTVAPKGLAMVSHTTLREQIRKCEDKIAQGDSSGAITNAYTLVEAVIKDLIGKLGLDFNPDQGDIRALYALLKEPLNLDPKSDEIGLHLKTVLDGFQKIVGGIHAVANKASDRHDRRYEPAPHHAKLVVNSAFALSDFLYDSFEYQRARRSPELPR